MNHLDGNPYEELARVHADQDYAALALAHEIAELLEDLRLDTAEGLEQNGHRHTKTTHRRIPEGGRMNDDDLICGENWDHDLEFEYDDDGSWVANCKECGAELWGDTND